MSKPVRVLIVEDSSLMRQMLTDILSEDDGIEVVGTAPDPYVARNKVKQLNPDVITLDVEMPKMDGLTFLEKIMSLRPTPVVMISGLTQENSETTLKALEIGAFDVIAKSKINVDTTLSEKEHEIIEKVKAASRANLTVSAYRKSNLAQDNKIASKPRSYNSSSKIVAIGSSAGGVEALRELLSSYPKDCPATLITQHMPEAFTANFARRLDGLARPKVQIAESRMPVTPGNVYIAPGDLHLGIRSNGLGYECFLQDAPLISGHKPSVNFLFHAMAEAIGDKAIGVILTGMGQDGAEGLLEMKKSGANTIGQDAVTSMVYGMPKIAFECGAVDVQLPLRKIAARILKYCG